MATRRLALPLFLFLLLATLTPSAARAQVSTFDLSGLVRDQQQSILPGATVTVTNEGSGLTRTVQTDENGRYFFAALPPQGKYTLVAELSGFSKFEQTGLEFYANTKPVLNVQLAVGKLEESVTVTSVAPLVDTGQATLGLSVNKEQIQELPLNGRDYLDLAVLGSGVSDVTGSGSTVLGSKSQSISGAYSRYTNYQLDGFNNTRDQHGVQKADISLDAIGEFRVLTNQFSAEFGETIGGIISAITKSGTNQLQGSAFLFVRPGDWDAKDTLTGVKAPFNRQDVGFTIGGPIARDRTHYFAAFEYRNEDQKAVVTAPIDNGSFQGAFPVGSNRTRVFGKVNHRFSANDLVDAKVIIGDETIRDGVGGLNISDNIRTNINDDWTLQGTYTKLFSSTLLNEFKLAYSNEDYSSTAEPSPFTPTGVALVYPSQANIGATNLLQTAPDISIEIADIFTLHRTAHTIKFGGGLFRSTPGGSLYQFLNGAYNFAPGAPYPYNPAVPASYPILYQQGFFGGGSPALELVEWHQNLFIQDDWKILPSLTLNLGLRYQRETSVPDNNNLGPRLGFAWDVTSDGRTVVRGGAGLFHSVVFSAVDAFEGFTNPNGFRTVTFSPGDPLFPTYPNVLPGPALPPGVVPPPGNFYAEIAKYAPSRRKSPESANYTIGIERQLGSSLSVSFDLSHNRGNKLLLPVDLNAPAYFDYSFGATRTAQQADATRPFGGSGRVILPGELPFAPDGFPYVAYRDLYMIDAIGISRYWAIRLAANHRMAHNFGFQANYTWSKAENNGDDFRPGNSQPLNPNDIDAEWGRSFTDIPHSFSLNGVYQLPWEFQVSGIVRARSGAPVDPRVGTDLNGDRNLRERPFSNGTVMERNSFRAPGYMALDLALSKRFSMKATHLEGRFEVFNLTNRLNASSVNSTYGPDATAPRSDFLAVTAAQPPRQFQVAVRFTF